MLKQKKAVSLMVSYVILITIVIGLSVGIYSWLKILANATPVADCEEGTSLILDSHSCSIGRAEFTLKNNGRFNVDGVVISVGNDASSFPTTYLIPYETGGVVSGTYYFNIPVEPGEIGTASFKDKEKIGGITQDITFNEIKIIQIQPFILDNNKSVICKNAVIKQEITDCIIG